MIDVRLYNHRSLPGVYDLAYCSVEGVESMPLSAEPGTCASPHSPGVDSESKILRDRDKLTKREREVLLEFTRCEGAKEVAHALHLSPRTVQYHAMNAFVKLGVNTILRAVLAAHRKGEITIEEL
jgi:DNA-binding NarL/FixJ family response regulator